MTPVVVVGAHWPGDRQRFTLAHELGHLVLDSRLSAHLDVHAIALIGVDDIAAAYEAMRQAERRLPWKQSGRAVIDTIT